MQPRDDADEIKARLNDRLEQVLDRFWSGWRKRGRIAYCAPNGEKDLGSFQVYLAQMGKYTRGSWVRSSASIGGDELNLFAYGFTGNHRATAEVFREAREFVGLDTARQETPEQARRREDLAAERAAKREADERRAQEHQEQRIASAGEIWAEGLPIAGTHAEAYLLARGLEVPPMGWDEVLRFHPSVVYDLDRSQRFPTLVCRVDDVFGDMTAVWKIHLDPKKPSKAPVDKAKIGMGSAAGAAVRLGGVGPRIGIAEGLETSLAARALIKYRYPVWATLSTSGMAGFETPIGVDRVSIFPDGDKAWRKQGDDLVISERPGRAAARKLGERLAIAGTKFDLKKEPPMREDYLDLWRARCAAEARA